MKTNIPSYGNGLAHMKCILCDYEVYQDSDWYMDHYDDDKDGWFTCPTCGQDGLSVIEDYDRFKMVFK